MEEEEIVQIALGKFMIMVDKDTAHKILNDDVFAKQYLEELTKIDQNSVSTDSTSAIPVVSPPNLLVKKKVWTTSRIQTDIDKAATTHFLGLRKKLNHKFSDKCTAKNSLWLEIAQSMNEAGFFVGDGVEGREKCRQKFVNLQSSYIKYVDKKRSTGEGRIEKPPFYEEIDEILGEKDKANPIFLIDSTNIKSTPLQECSNSKADDWLQNIPSTSSSHCLPTSNSATSSESAVSNLENTSTPTKVNRFKKCTQTVTPKKNEILEKFYTLAERSEQRQKMEFQTVIELMKDESQKRHEQLMALISALNRNSQPRKRKRDTSESD